MTVDALHDLQNHRLPSLHPYEVVQSRVELVRHLTRKVVKPVEPCDGKDLTGEKKKKKRISFSHRDNAIESYKSGVRLMEGRHMHVRKQKQKEERRTKTSA